KSEFLANMSHELRTPLNSLLILAEMLAENNEGNLTPKQTEFAQTIYSSGSDLLALINDILDMAKIESGTMAIEVSELPFPELRDYVERTFRPVAENRRLAFTTELAGNLPRFITTDAKRLQQVLRNLLSNAFKFTERGRIELRVERVTSGWSTDHPLLSRIDGVIAFSIHDTGIGIAADKLKIIFEPFQQADMGTSRKYGGTGLGLSISREIARLLGGEIRVQSTPGEGSTFTLYVPQTYPAPLGRVQPANGLGAASSGFIPVIGSRHEASSTLPAQAEVRGDHDTIQPGDPVLLIVEDDPEFADILLDIGHDKGFKCLITPCGENVLHLAQTLKPAAITLDLRLPDMDGWVVLDRLKHDPNTRHIPVHIISVEERGQRDSSQHGAFAYLVKPVSRPALDKALQSMKSFLERPTKNLLVVEDNALERDHVVSLVGNGDVRITAVGTGAEALAALATQRFDCLVLDLGLPDMSGFELLTKIKKDLDLQNLPVIVHTGKDLTREEEARLKEMAAAILIKDVRSLERLLDETALFLHRVLANLPPSAQQLLEQAHKTDPVLADKKVLIVDDDFRNLFALTSILERWQMQVVRAENGREALEVLQRTPDLDIVLMDIMMPEMDGYETMRAIRAQESFVELPIIALTAKAMKSDRLKCLEAGATDYIAKPVNAEQLLALLRVWLSRRGEQETRRQGDKENRSEEL
ncbi:MAG: response regulator, partial [Gemmataceae bacterium]|nr:response regulator [Gemmataceae bacterium]